MKTFVLAMALSFALAPAALAQSSSSITVHQTPVGPVTHSQTVSPVGNGSVTTNTLSPGNNTTVQPYVGATTHDPHPTNTQSTTTFSVGVAIPLGSSPASSGDPK